MRTGTIFGREVPLCLQPFVKYTKSSLYQMYFVEGCGALKAQISRKTLTRILNVLRIVFILYLLFCTVFVYLYAVSVMDNNIIDTILLMISIQWGIEIFVTGPVKCLLMAGLIPVSRHYVCRVHDVYSSQMPTHCLSRQWWRT